MARLLAVATMRVRCRADEVRDAPHGPLLSELDVVGVGWCATADQTRLSSHEFKMFAVTLSHWLADDNHRLSAWFVPH